MFKRCITLLSIALLMSACAQRQDKSLQGVNTANLNELESVRVSLRSPSGQQTKLSALREHSLRDSAMSIGAQGGLAWASTEINQKMKKDDQYLDSIYNFHALVLEHGVIPPVLIKGDNNVNLADPNTLRIADRSYKVAKQARFGSTAPNWREYLVLNYPKPPLPDRTLLPKNDLEQRIWREGIRMGWEQGIKQAYSIYRQNLARLKRDYSGMLLYRKLLEQRMISPPFVATTEMGVTGDGENMRINDQVLRIVALPQLQTNSKGWKAIVVKKHE